MSSFMLPKSDFIWATDRIDREVALFLQDIPISFILLIHCYAKLPNASLSGSSNITRTMNICHDMVFSIPSGLYKCCVL